MKRIFFTIMIMVVLYELEAQQNYQPPVLHSPEVSSLMKEVQTPVSLSSGTVNIDVPIYTFKHGFIEIPISLAYDASGVRVDAQPTWVGQNWSLKVGGMISRIVKGAPDETYVEEDIILNVNGQNQLRNKYSIGYAYNTTNIRNSDWNTTTQIDSWAKNQSFELEPDEFMFNFCGHSGKFYINENGKIICTDKRYVVDMLIYNNIPIYDGRVTFNINNPSTSSFTYYKSNIMSNIEGFVRWHVSRIMGFRITAPDGTKYYFGMFHKDEEGTLDIYTDDFSEVEITADFFDQFFIEEFSSWHLAKIVSPKNDVVEFKYEKGDPWVNFSSSYSVNKIAGQATYGVGWIFGGKVSASNFSAGQQLNGKFIRPVFLSEIRSPNEVIEFKRSNSATLRYNYNIVNFYLGLASEKYDRYIYISPRYDGQLPIIMGYNALGQKIIDYTYLKTSKLDEIVIQSYKSFEFQYNEGSNTRLQLTSINEKNGSETIPFLSFKYNTSIQIPGFLDIRNDHWGYYNNKMAQVDYNSTSSLIEYYSLREPDPAYQQAGILEEIRYPTGGYKKFVYEPNKYNRVVVRNTSTGNLSLQSTAEKIGGGLRVKEIIENDGTVSFSTKYTYLPGILNGEIQYYWGNYQGKLFNGNTYTAERFFSCSLLPVSSNSEGGSVSYSKVTESQNGNGRTEYTFSNHDNTLDENSVSIDLQKSPYSPLSSKVVERGKLLEKLMYKEGSTAPLIRETFNYSILNNNPEYLRSVYIRRLALFNAYEINVVEGSAYKIYIYPYNVTTKTEYFNHTNGTVQNNHQWTYDSRNQMITSISNNGGVNTKKEFKYPYNYSDAVYTQMTGKNIVSPVIEEITSVKNGIETERTKVNYTHKTDNLYVPFSAQHSFSGENDLVTINTFDLYDTKCNILQTTNTGGVKTAFIWAYNETMPVVKAENITYSSLKSAVESVANTDIDTFWSGFSDIAVNTTQQSNWKAFVSNLMNNTSLAGARLTLYTYRPLVGMTSETDASGRIIYYEYDGFGRLKQTRDDSGNIIKHYEYHYQNEMP